MYKISENYSLQVWRHVIDIPTNTIVFHIHIWDNFGGVYDDYVELQNGISRALRISENYPTNKIIEAYDTESLTYYDSAIASLEIESELLELIVEDYLRIVGILPAEYEEETEE